MAGKYDEPITIEAAIKSIVKRNYLIPAIQRKFIWDHEQICALFDSIMRKYPINTFMSWQVRSDEIKSSFRFYQFLEEYCELFEENNPDFDLKGHGDFRAIIDGQQRLTALYIGLKGSYAYKLHRKHWPDCQDDAVMPRRKLFLELKEQNSEETENMLLYNFKFLSKEDYEELSAPQNWFEVGQILELTKPRDKKEISTVIKRYLVKNGLLCSGKSISILERLFKAIREDHILHFYNETDQNIDHVLDIFIRTNSGGTPLSFSDLLMSVLIANWKQGDDQNGIREQVDDFVKKVRSSYGFHINKDVILKSCLTLATDDVKFKVKNFNKSTVEAIETQWPDIKCALDETFQLIKNFGLVEDSFRAKNAAVPIAYYIYKKRVGAAPLYQSINQQAKNQKDRELIAKWLHMSLLKGVFGGQGDAVITALRRVINKNLGNDFFPLKEIIEEFKGKKKEINFDKDFVEHILKTQKDDANCFSILALLFPYVDFTRTLHKDHLHPEHAFQSKNLDQYAFLQGKPDKRAFYSNKENWNSIANLCLLDGSLNSSKKHKPLAEWVNEKDHKQRLEYALIENDCDLSFEAFPEFITQRRGLLKNRLLSLIGEENITA